MSNADGNEASAMKNINEALKIRHPISDPLYNQSPNGQVYEPLNEDACAGLAAAIALFGGRSLWLSYESFAINGWPIVQTVSQAMAELRRKTPSQVDMFTAGALEQGRNGWTHQRPGDRVLLRGHDAQRQSLPAVPLRCQHDPGGLRVGARHAQQVDRDLRLEDRPAGAHHAGAGAAGYRGRRHTLYETDTGDGPLVVLAVAGDMILLPAFIARDALEQAGIARAHRQYR